MLILACDGLWDVMSHQEAANFAQNQRAQGKNAKEVAQALVREALDKKTEDNVTCVVVFFNWDPNATVPTSSEDASASAHESPAVSEHTTSDPAPAESKPADSKPAEEFGAFPPMENAPSQ